MLKILLSFILALGFPFLALADNNSSSSVGVINALGTTNTNTGNTATNTAILSNISSGSQTTQVQASGYTAGTSVLLHTVGTGKTFHLSTITLAASVEAGASVNYACNLAVYTSGAVLVTTLAGLPLQTSGLSSETTALATSFPYPYSIPSTDTINVVSTSNDINCTSTIEGWEA